MKKNWKPTIVSFISLCIIGIGFSLNADTFMTIKGLILSLGISIGFSGFVHFIANSDKKV